MRFMILVKEKYLFQTQNSIILCWTNYFLQNFLMALGPQSHWHTCMTIISFLGSKNGLWLSILCLNKLYMVNTSLIFLKALKLWFHCCRELLFMSTWLNNQIVQVCPNGMGMAALMGIVYVTTGCPQVGEQTFGILQSMFDVWGIVFDRSVAATSHVRIQSSTRFAAANLYVSCCYISHPLFCGQAEALSAVSWMPCCNCLSLMSNVLILHLDEVMGIF